MISRNGPFADLRDRAVLPQKNTGIPLFERRIPVFLTKTMTTRKTGGLHKG